MSTEQQPGTALAKTEPAGALVREDAFGLSIEYLTRRVDKIRQVRDNVMHEGAHYGKIPGVDKPTLLKPGAEILCMAFQLAPTFELEERRDGEHLEVIATCTLTNTSGGTVGNGIGSCSTREAKYAWRKGERSCPECGKPCIIKGKAEYGGGWLCWGKRGGCGSKFADGDQAIEGQQTERIPNPDLADQYNTARKMACKRALVAAALFVTGASELFTQDVEDMPRNGDDAEPAPTTAAKSARKPAAQKPVPVATEKDVLDVLACIREAQSTDALEAVSKANRNRKWGREQKDRMHVAYQKRLAELTNPANDAQEPDDYVTDGLDQYGSVQS